MCRSICYEFHSNLCHLLCIDWLWRCDCRTCRNPQFRWNLEGQFHHLHCDKILVLSVIVCNLWHSHGSYLGHFFCHFVILPHLGRGAVYQKLPNWDPVHWPSLFYLYPYLLWPILWGCWQNAELYQSNSTKGSINDISRSWRIRFFPPSFIVWCQSQGCHKLIKWPALNSITQKKKKKTNLNAANNSFLTFFAT